MMVAGAQGGGYALGIWLPTYLSTVRGISAVGTGGYLLVLILGAFFGFVAGAYLRRRRSAARRPSCCPPSARSC